MITRVEIKSFKSLENVELDLGQVNVFIGANGSGKSNLLEAIGVLGAAAFGRVDDEALLRRGVRPGVPKLYKSAFPHKPHERRPHIFFGAHNGNSAYEVALFNPLNDPKPAWRYMSENFEGPTGKIVGRSPFRIQELESGKALNPEQGYAALKSVELGEGDAALGLLDGLRNYCIYSANTATLRGLSPDQQLREPLGLSGGRLPEAVLELLQARRKEENGGLAEKVGEILPLIDWAKSFGSGPSSAMPLSPSAAASKTVVRFADQYMVEKRNTLTGYDASEGALYILFAAVVALHPKSPNFVAVDNLDQAINPLLAKRLAQAFCNWILDAKTTRQVILTAHNAAVLDGLPLKDDRVRLFSVDRNNVGHTVARRIELSDKLLAKASEGWTLSRLWMNGLIGGVPTNL